MQHLDVRFYGKSFNKVALPAAFVSCFLFSTSPVYAQANGANDTIEEVSVTGTRIRQDPLSQGSPVTTLTAEDLDRSGLTSVGDFLQRLTASGGGLNSRFNSSGNFGFPPDGGGIGAGASQIDLRYLGSNRTLVLVDGVRWVNGSSASGVSSAVDLNTIPTAIIERIEVLEDGASSIYGSDAIAGVVNIITKKDFDGFEIEAYSGAYDEGDGESNEINLSIGTIGDRSRIFLNIGYVNANDVLAADRDQASTPIPFVTNGLGGSSGTPQGRFFFTDPNTGLQVDCTINDGVTGVPRYDAANPCGPNDDFSPFTTADRFNFSPFNLVLAPNERTNIYTQAQYDLTPSTTFYLKGLFNNRKSTNQAAPEPLFIGPEAGNGNLLDTISADASNPFNPFGFTLDANTNPFFFGRRPSEGGPRVFEQDVNTFYVGAGLQGQFELGDRNFYWDVNFARSENRADQIKTGGYNSARIQEALGPDCTGSCVPLNLFGGQGDGNGTITQEQLDFISFVQKDVSEQELLNVTANISGDLFQLPAGPFAFAAGIEYREQDGFFQPDAVVVAGESAGIQSTPTRGGFDIEEYYLELQIPILENLPGADLLDLSLAIRNSDYSTFGSESTSKIGFKYRPVSNILLRGSFSEGLRAPGIGELFGSAARFDQTLADPCSDILGTQNGAIAADPQTVANCAALGVPVDGGYVQFNPQISVTTGGNRELQPEESDSITLGFVYDADWVDNQDWIEQFTVEGTYYEHEIDGAIQALDAQVQLEGCISTLDSGLCNGITRTSGGVINGFSNQLTNIGGIETSGYDLSFVYLSPTYRFGQIKLTWQNTFLDEYIEQVPTSTGFIDVHLEGTETGDPEQAYPELKSTLTSELFYDNWAFAATFRYIDEVTEDCTGLDGLGLCSNEAEELNVLEDTLYVDLAATWSLPTEQEITLSAGVLNVTDEDSPTCFSCALNGFDATTYDVPGVFSYLRFNIKL